MSRLLGHRDDLIAALEAGAIRTATVGRLAAPVVLVEPAEPWSEPSRLSSRGRTSYWRLTAIAGRADSEAALAELAELLEAVEASLPRAWQIPTWGVPRDVTLEGVPYAATVGRTQYTDGD